MLARNLDAFLALVADVLLRPTFAPAELARTKREIVAQIEELRTDDRALCARFFARNVYGDHPYGHPPDGPARRDRGGDAPPRSPPTSSAVRRAATSSSPSSGDVDRRDFAARARARFKGMRDRGAAARTRWSCARPSPPKGWRIQLVDKPDRQQTQLMFGHPALRATDPDYVAARWSASRRSAATA